MKPAIHCAHDAVWPTAKLKPHPKNPNHHPASQIQLLADIIKAQGWRSPICVSLRSGYVTKGHGRLQAAILAGMKSVPVDLQKYKSDAAEMADMIADNRIAELSDREPDALALILRGLQGTPEIKLTGYDSDVIASLLDRDDDAPADGAGSEELTKAKALQKKWKTKPDQLWLCGRHRIICADCTIPANWDRLMQDQEAQLVYTDPPYGVAYQDSAGTEIKNDKLQRDALAKLVRQSLECALPYARPDAAFYIWHASATRRDFEFALDQVGLQERQYITWVKDSFTLGHADYHWQTEPCFYAEKAGQHAKWFGDRTQGTVWRIKPVKNDRASIAIANGLFITDGAGAHLFVKSDRPQSGKLRHIRLDPSSPAFISDKAVSTAWEVSRDPRADYLHPTQKPAALARIAILNSTAPDDLVVDQFSGSGSTLIACERAGRQARAMDLAPEYVAVALERWSKLTGEKPILEKS